MHFVCQDREVCPGNIAGMQWNTWEGFYNSMFLPLWHHSICMAVCAGRPEVLTQGTHYQHLVSEKGEEMLLFPVEPGLRGREGSSSQLGGGSGVPWGMLGLMSGVWQLGSF